MLAHEVTSWSVDGRRIQAGFACLAVTLCWATAIPSLCIADEPAKDEGGADKQVKEESAFSGHLRAAGEHHRKRLHLAMQLRREEIDRAVKLGDAQGKKVEIAAKGAVARVIDRWLEQMLANSDFEVQFGQMQAEQARASLIGLGADIGVEQVIQEEIWKNGVKQQFSVAQRKLYEKMVAERRTFERSVSISQLLVQLDRVLRLSNQQRQTMTELLDGSLDEEFTFGNSGNPEAIFARAILNQGAAAGPVDPFAAPGASSSPENPLAKVANDKAGKILSKAQLQRWGALRADPSALYSGHGEGLRWMEGGLGNFFIDGNGLIEINGRVIVE